MTREGWGLGVPRDDGKDTKGPWDNKDVGG
jgi:hypothetical protein